MNRTKITRKQKWEEKQLYFKQQTSDISREKIRTGLRKGNLNKETESLQMAAQNYKNQLHQSKNRKTQQNSKCRSSCERDETIKHIISECRNAVALVKDLP